VFTIGEGKAEIPLGSLGAVKGVKAIYPRSEDCEYEIADGALKVKMPEGTCARLFEIALG